MFRNSGIRLTLASAALLAAASVGSAQVKVGIIDLQKAVLGSAEITKANTAMEAKYKPKQLEAEKLAKELQTIQQNIQSGKLSDLGVQDAQEQGKRKQKELTRINEDLTADTERDRTEILSRSTERMRQVVKKLAEDKGIDVIIDVSSAFYYKPALELTAEAIAAYDKAYPAK